MGYAARHATDPPRSFVTTSLSVDFAANARPGDWIEARMDVMRPGTRVAFINCFVYLGDSGSLGAAASSGFSGRASKAPQCSGHRSRHRRRNGCERRVSAGI